jgi:hypothetical protein
MSKNNNRKIIIIISVLYSIAGMAQNPIPSLDPNIGFEFLGSYQYWKAEDDNISQFSVPVKFVLPVNDQLLLDFVTTPASSKAVTAQEYRLGGMSDTRMRGSFLFDNEKLLFTFGLNLPSGKNSLNLEELSAAKTLSLHALNFQVPILGQGFDASAGVIMAQPLGPMVIGIGGGFLYRGKYRPYENVDLNYDPGEEISLSLGLDIPMTRKDKIILDLSFTLYSNDKSNDVAVFQAGNRFSFNGMYYIPREIWSYLFSIKSRLQTKNKIGSGELVPERLNSNNRENELSFTTFLNWDRKSTYFALLQSKFFSDNAIGTGAVSLGGIGIGLEKQLFSKFKVSATTIVNFGKYKSGSETVNLFGFEMLGGLKVFL